MKKSCILPFMLMGFLLFSFFSAAHAFPVNIVQEIRSAGGPGTTAGGEFRVYGWSSSAHLVQSSCSETSGPIIVGSRSFVQDISKEARAGGSGGLTPDPITEFTAFRYHNFYWGNLPGYAYTGAADEFASRDESANALQRALRWFEEKIGGQENFHTGLAHAAMTTGAWSGRGDVRVMNVLDVQGKNGQDQLPVASVPEPATMLLLGAGLMGLAGLGKRNVFRR